MLENQFYSGLFYGNRYNEKMIYRLLTMNMVFPIQIGLVFLWQKFNLLKWKWVDMIQNRSK